MYPELTNLLPLERMRHLRRDYFIRLATVVVLALSVVVVGSGALLIPSYLYLNQELQARSGVARELDTKLSASQGKVTSQRLATLSSSATYLARLATTTTATAALRGVLGVPRSGVALTGFTFSPSIPGTNGKMALTGNASTRETLRAYVMALSQLPYVSNADLPISAYAKESQIPFTITLTGTLLP
ncbi:MAG: hypothetical protein JWO84_360 [Parcubacteria group bacterium]|nr:hypothetical protein [Parcubacteria group bacterium]